MLYKDCTGRNMQIGDVILFTMSTDGSAARMEAGRVTRFNPKSIVVQPVDPVTFANIQREVTEAVPTGRFNVYYEGTSHERRYEINDYVVVGMADVQEKLIPKPKPYRFFILKRV